MAKEVLWTLSKYTLMCEQGMLSDEDCKILKMHIKNHSNLEIALELGYADESPINDAINRLKLIYDELQHEFPDILAPRTKGIYTKRAPKPE